MNTSTQEPKRINGFEIGDVAYIVEHCPEPTTEQAEDDSFDVVCWQMEKTVQEVFPTLVRAIAFARKAVKASIFGVIDIWEAELVNPYRSEIPDWQIKRTALKWQKNGGYECEVWR